MTQIDYITLDVFTRERFRGNPLAVIADARGLDAETMQAIAREFQYSEITFVLPPADADNTAEVRIFTPTMELPFAGHPNVGTAFALARAGHVFGKPVGDSLRFEETAGIVAVTVERDADGAVTGASIEAPQRLTVADGLPVETLGPMIGLAPSAIAIGHHAPLFLSVALPFLVAELPDLETLGAARPDMSLFAAAEAGLDPVDGRLSVFVYVRSGAEPTRLRARMFAPLDTIPEDPATGSASAALAAFLAPGMVPGAETVELTIVQGVEMGRESRIHLRVAMVDCRAASVRIRGDCVEMMRGALTV
ncbi:PhzF family phenazine biosynthesis protein [Rhizobium sp. Leaf384]|uniref:PhzF family phenazine biosynthesis protein n=1 Tax=unclassified Rhizobium TaxID=2613769 RepID=UPI000714A327|nr:MULTISPECIES: PhzF family phenazine biosynthesis protein [unclassified Rhizobium]KQR75838.1 PhzF family phenazine biosynthesis protein [Rhizobium sp. Leaf341]KQS76490.1 PhzF family phenazine biosynthesis protein [Rhizobium sp. Leaf383]KQS77759.1 PhzF family phenazine biosynthesis protein [Rhizobium sp. Leaf384]